MSKAADTSQAGLSMEAMLAGLRAAAEPTRLRLLGLCASSELTVSELTRILGQSQPRISRHLRLLCEAGLLERTREGVFAFYRVAPRGPGGRLVRQLLDGLSDHDVLLAADRAGLDRVRTERAEAAQSFFRENAESWDRLRGLHVPVPAIDQHILGLACMEQPGDVLDVGTGTAHIPVLIGGRARSLSGIDSSREMLAVARGRLDDAGLRDARLHHGDMAALPFSAGRFDTVTLHMALHYAEQPDQVLHEVARVLRPCGHLVLVDYTAHDLVEMQERYAHRHAGFDLDRVNEWLSAAGFGTSRARLVSADPVDVMIVCAQRIADQDVRTTKTENQGDNQFVRMS